jgi:hypothetical protein
MSSDHDTPMTDDEEQTQSAHDTHETAANTDPRAQASDTTDYERAPKDFEADVDATTVKVPDYPVFVYPKIKGEKKECSAYLVTQGEIADYAEDAPDDADAQDFGIEAIVELLNTKYVSPEFDLSVEDYRNAPAGYHDEFFNQLVPELGN